MLMSEATLEAHSLSTIAKTLRSLFKPDPNVPAIMLATLEPLNLPPAYSLATVGSDHWARLP